MVVVVVWGKCGRFDAFLAEGIGSDEGELRTREISNGLLLYGAIVAQLVFLTQNVADAHLER